MNCSPEVSLALWWDIKTFTRHRPLGAGYYWADNSNWFLMKKINSIRNYSMEFHFLMGLKHKWLCKIILRSKGLWVWTGFHQLVTDWEISHSFFRRIRKTEGLPWLAHSGPQNFEAHPLSNLCNWNFTRWTFVQSKSGALGTSFFKKAAHHLTR